MSELHHICLEITRRCNLHCKHCLRGEPEPVDLDVAKFSELLQRGKVTYIRAITLSGGEPSQNISGIFQLIDMFKSQSIEVSEIYLATNGTCDRDEFFVAIRRLFKFAKQPHKCVLAISSTSYHYESMRSLGISRPSVSYIVYRLGADMKDRVYTMGLNDCFVDGIVNEGRAKSLPRTIPPREYGVFINVYGEMFNYADISYQTQRARREGNLKKISVLSLEEVTI